MYSFIDVLLKFTAGYQTITHEILKNIEFKYN